MPLASGRDLSEEFSLRSVPKRQLERDAFLAEMAADQGYSIPKGRTDPTKVREFVAWDGEGITYSGDPAQSYVLFGCSAGRYVVAHSLSSIQCLDLLLAVEIENPDAIHVGFALKYDCNMILRDLPRINLWQIYRKNKTFWKGYKIEYRPGKWFNVRKGKQTVRLFDVFGFFQSSFVVACEKYLGPSDDELVRVRAGKLARSDFRFEDLRNSIIPYWRAELRLIVRLLDSLRADLDSAGIRIHSWHGPGAVANTVFGKHSVRKHYPISGDLPADVERAAQYGYAAGRFELYKAGHYNGDVWEYDIRSAYPAAIAGLPSLHAGTWEFEKRFDENSFGIWRISRGNDETLSGSLLAPQSLYRRDRRGNISYPNSVEGWYWTPEACLVSPSEIIGGWVWHPSSTELPFSFVTNYYNTRAQWKREGNSAQRALKLVLNSLYGKTAQRVGWDPVNRQIPVWHQLQWAGYVTSTTRAKLYRALCLAGAHALAVETDAIFSTIPLDGLQIGEGLGEWEESVFNDITYIQSGMYWATKKNGEVIERYRGFDKGSLTRPQVLHHLQGLDGDKKLEGRTTRFIGMGLGLQTKAEWLSWQTEPKTVNIGGGGKRAHIARMCPECRSGMAMSDGLHSLMNMGKSGPSFPHHIPWNTDYRNGIDIQDELEKW